VNRPTLRRPRDSTSRTAQLPFQVGGLLLLAIRGLRRPCRVQQLLLRRAATRQLDEMEGLVDQLEEKHRVFRRRDVRRPRPTRARATIGALTSTIAGQMGAAFACCYLVSADGKAVRAAAPPASASTACAPQTVNRKASGPLLSAIEAGQGSSSATKQVGG